MPFNLLLLPLLGGYIFVTYWNYTKYQSLRESGHRLVFRAAIVGFFLLGSSRAIVLALNKLCPLMGELWKALIPFDYAGTAVLAFFLGYLAFPANWFFSVKNAADKALYEVNDGLELMLSKSLSETKGIEVTLRSGKFYVGTVTSYQDPAYPRVVVDMLPTASGYRNPDDMRLVFTTDYMPIYQKILTDKKIAEDDSNNVDANKSLDHLELEDFVVVFPLREVASARIFDYSAHAAFQWGENSQNAEKEA